MGRPKKIQHPPIEKVFQSMQEEQPEIQIVERIIDLPAIIEKYNQLCETQSDINELLPIIKEVASHCDHCTEFGVRNPTSTYAILAGNPKKLVSYDIGRYPEVDQVEALAPNFTFILGSSLDVEIEETDFLFIDTYHTATQLERELSKHASKVRKYIGFHDVVSFWNTGEPPYPGITGGVDCGRGLRYAIEPFMQNHSEWVQDFRADYNNGILILRRIN